MGITGSPAPHSHQYGFRLIIDDFERAEFMTCGPLGSEIAAVEIREGGRRTPQFEPGLVTPKDVVCERGVTANFDMYNWLKQTEEGKDGFRRTATVEELLRDGGVGKRWTIEACWPTDVELGSWDNKTSEALIEKVTLKNEGVTLDSGGGGLSISFSFPF